MRFKGSKVAKEIGRMEKDIFLREIDGVTDRDGDVNKFYDNYITAKSTAEVSVDDNANVMDSSIISYYNEAPKSIFKKACFEFIAKNVSNAAYKSIKEGYLYVQDATSWFKPYCYAFDSSHIVASGIPYNLSKPLKISPPKHSHTYVNLHVQATSTISNSIAGAVSWPSFFVYLDWYLRNENGYSYWQDKDTVRDTLIINPGTKQKVEQLFQELVFGLNYNFRGGQSPFCNMSVYDKDFLKDMYSNVVYPDGTAIDLESVDELQKWFAEWFVGVNQRDQPFTFPVMTAALHAKDGKIQDIEFLKWISEVNCETGVFNIYAGELGQLSTCCRLRNDFNAFTNMLGTPSVSVGSTRVVTLNLAQIALASHGVVNFATNLKTYYDQAVAILVEHRKMLEAAIDNGKHPLYTEGWINIKRQYCTIGFIGMAEAIEILSEYMDGKLGYAEIGANMLNTMNRWNEANAKTHKYLFNVEQIPGESAGVKLAKKANFLFGTEYEILSNQYTPLVDHTDILERIKTHGELDGLTQGGGILHLNLEEKITTPLTMQKLIEYTVSQGVIYFAVNYNIAQCNSCLKNYVGKFESSPCCGAGVTNWLRIVGYLRPVSSWGKARKKEYEARQFYKGGYTPTKEVLDKI